jgi:2-keto-3-deoxy-6-phosphogluconate aldolase
MSTETFYAKVLDLKDEDSGKTELLVALDIGYTQVRAFSYEIFEGMELEINDTVILTTEISTGCMKITVEKTNDNVEHYFEVKDIFGDLKGSSFFTEG